MAEYGFATAHDLAATVGISDSQMSMIRRGTRRIHQDFITGSLRAFPDKTFDDLFYVEDDPQTVDTGIEDYEIQDQSSEPVTVARG